MGHGKLVLVVGPSGVGKDSLLATAKEHLQDDDRVIFTRRYITREQDAGGEDHLEISAEEFERKQEAGDFALYWDAHGLKYGVPASTLRDVKSGHTVVVNVSRSVIDVARRTYPSVIVASITTAPEILRERLHGRGRESLDDIEARIARATAFQINGDDVVEIDNSGALETAAQNFVKVIEARELLSA
ncbi:phosphonate metabolism protein/1,5-bisphosphokinase (PRPP-forming) PhnN [Sneathiella sp. P13V-1]|uniref:phosphonate metabolism protein/1,5-bisphosphokinase (PRPP-forming) PhnN n=1 Tax=Sneathiella sp. P13V-1 TaxID=2697366 RepID=UPI00187B62C1|nr:phosphonate metabolism protein/1,5-bisphosphokinase (PRPP-forming) PhnN [Sneathiella sp. P13V-1]MBE7638637.1 phosphonate metabolism protein/1,5-bisphosphokinase (PRPP-forming) PhnN [Sneathiella sp. P13V-1]